MDRNDRDYKCNRSIAPSRTEPLMKNPYVTDLGLSYIPIKLIIGFGSELSRADTNVCWIDDAHLKVAVYIRPTIIR